MNEEMMDDTMNNEPQDSNEGVSSSDLSTVEKLKEGYDKIRSELSKVIVGQDEVIEQILIGIFSRGHCLLVGVPGLAKTLIDQYSRRLIVIELLENSVHS